MYGGKLIYGEKSAIPVMQARAWIFGECFRLVMGSTFLSPFHIKLRLKKKYSAYINVLIFIIGPVVGLNLHKHRQISKTGVYFNFTPYLQEK